MLSVALQTRKITVQVCVKFLKEKNIQESPIRVSTTFKISSQKIQIHYIAARSRFSDFLLGLSTQYDRKNSTTQLRILSTIVHCEVFCLMYNLLWSATSNVLKLSAQLNRIDENITSSGVWLVIRRALLSLRDKWTQSWRNWCENVEER